MTKYKEYYLKMLEDNKELFDEFKKVHDKYQKNDSIQEEYNQAGKPVIEIIREYEDRLCNRSEGSGYGSYAGNLADKFWSEIRGEFPLIDRVGIIIKKVPQTDFFEIKKITLT